MRLGLIGLGRAGGAIVDRFLAYDARTDAGVVASAHAIDTTRADLDALDRVSPANRVLIGGTRVKGGGVGGDVDLAAEIAREDAEEIMRALDAIPVTGLDALLLVAGLGGGTGSGVGPVVAERLDRLYAVPVYGLGVLPAGTEGGGYTLNAARSLRDYVRATDNVLLFDNDAWRPTDGGIEDGYRAMNDELARRCGVLFGAGEVGRGRTVAESVVDASEITNTLGTGGISAIGHARSEIAPENGGLLSRLLGRRRDPPDDATAATRITTLIRQAALGRLTLPCELSAVERALVVVSGPPAYLDRKGIERGRRWLEEATGSIQIRGGDNPLPDERAVAATVLLSGLSDVPRIEALGKQADDAREAVRDPGDPGDRDPADVVIDDDLVIDDDFASDDHLDDTT